jgi:restriction system protein
LLNLPEELLEKKHDPDSGNQTEVKYRLAWARTYLKKFGLIENASRGVWSLTQKAKGISKVDPDEIVKFVRGTRSTKPEKKPKPILEEIGDTNPIQLPEWRAELYRVLTTDLSPAGFERLIQRLLRVSGFVQVEVTGRSGDGGIDGKGIAKIHGLLSLHVHFQCKRYRGSVSTSEIRDFRGAIQGRGDKGLFITTGTFTRDAVKEASRDGASPIDLLDGEALIDKLKELKLGVSTSLIEKVTIDSAWFGSI